VSQSSLSSSNAVNLRFSIIASVVIAILIVDSSLGKIYNLLTGIKSSDTGVTIFIAISSLYSIGLILLLELLKHWSDTRKSKTSSILHLYVIQQVVVIAQYCLIVLLAITLFQILIISQYNTIILILSTTISYTLSIGIITLLSVRFFSWFQFNRNFATLLYGLSSGVIAANALITLTFVDSTLRNFTTVVTSNVALNSTTQVQDSFTVFVNNAYFWSSISSFVLIWISTAVVMRNYSNRIGRYKYWILVSLPLVYFLTQFISIFFNLFTPFMSADPVLFSIFFTLVFSLSKLAGGVLFGIAFWTMGRSLPKGNIVREYMAISAFGVILFFVSDQNSIISSGAQYPPFGVATVSFLGFSSYMMLIGLYCAIMSISGDMQLRRIIRKLALKELQLLDNVATAEVEREIEKRILKVTREHEETLTDQTGIEPSLSVDDAKQYLEQVIAEVKTHKG
jgi:hypothetical protein